MFSFEPPAQYSNTSAGCGPSLIIPNVWTIFGCGDNVLNIISKQIEKKTINPNIISMRRLFNQKTEIVQHNFGFLIKSFSVTLIFTKFQCNKTSFPFCKAHLSVSTLIELFQKRNFTKWNSNMFLHTIF